MKNKINLFIIFLCLVQYGICQKKVVFSFIENGKYPFFALTNIENMSSKEVPELYSAYFYPTFKMGRYGDWSYFIIQIIKNFKKQNGWNLKLHSSEVLFSFNGQLRVNNVFPPEDENGPNEGWVGYGKHNLTFNEWNPYNPNLYNLTVTSFSDPSVKGTPQVFNRIVGVRVVKYGSSEEIFINTLNYSLKKIKIDSEEFDRMNLHTIKKNHFNAIISNDLIPKETLSICDSIGLMAIQNLGSENIQDTTGFLINYFDQYTHPSLIAWNVSDSPELVQILSELDPKRPIIDLKPEYQEWNELDSADRVRLMHNQQPYSFWFNRQEGTIKLLENHDFYDLEMKIEWSVFQDGVNIEAGQFQFDENIEAKIESLKNLDPSLNLIISLKAAENKLHYQQGDLISWDEFYFLENEDFVETKKKIF